MAVPRDKLWLTALNEARGSLTLTGTAMDNETVAVFMDNLEASEFIGTVDLQSTRMRNLPEYRLRVSDFVLNCSTVFPKEEEEPKPATSKRGKPGRKKAK
jgi:type IV pilus assembly protein PilN